MILGAVAAILGAGYLGDHYLESIGF
jgi:hypothetical protein